MTLGVNDLESHWMPFSGNRDFKNNPRLISKSKGMYYYNQNGEPLIDGCSGLFCSPIGHGRKEIADAVHAQILTNDYSPHFQMGHEGSFALANKIAAITPDDINHVFFVNSGSESIDTAIKIALQYHKARKDAGRIRFVSREKAYHGVNIGGVSLSGMIKNRESFPATMPHVALLRHTWIPENRFTRGMPENGGELADDLQRMVDTYGANTIAACFVEPVAGSIGCLVPPKGYLERLREICTKYGILLVFDEVITGFGRLGKPFASQAFGVTPDIITLAKAITNGNIPMGAVAVKDSIYDTIMNDAPKNAVEFFHGYTWSANPVASACANVVQDLYKTEDLFNKADQLAPYLEEQFFKRLENHNLVFDIRNYGLMLAVEIRKDGVAPGVLGTEVQKQLFWKGLHVKFTGDNGIFAPAFIASHKHIDEMIDVLEEVLDDNVKNSL